MEGKIELRLRLGPLTAELFRLCTSDSGSSGGTNAGFFLRPNTILMNVLSRLTLYTDLAESWQVKMSSRRVGYTDTIISLRMMIKIRPLISFPNQPGFSTGMPYVPCQAR